MMPDAQSSESVAVAINAGTDTFEPIVSFNRGQSAEQFPLSQTSVSKFELYYLSSSSYQPKE